MKFAVMIGLGAALSGTFLAAAPAKPTSVYGKLFDAPDCKVDIAEGDENGPSSEEYDCAGPIAGVRTVLLTGNDWDHLWLKLDGKSYSLWEPMVSVGSFSGVGNRKGIVEWLFAPGKPHNRARLKSFIVRFSGAVMGEDGNFKGDRSQLAVFDLTQGKLCWKGNFGNNTAARKAATDAPCKTMLKAEDPAAG
jgi:hypothetical protein